MVRGFVIAWDPRCRTLSAELFNEATDIAFAMGVFHVFRANMPPSASSEPQRTSCFGPNVSSREGLTTKHR